MSHFTGRVCAQLRDAYMIQTPYGELMGAVDGKFRFNAQARRDFPAVGDWVTCTRASSEETVIHAVLPRSSCIVRKSAGTTSQEQVIAANVDTVLIVVGLDQDFNVRRMERYVALVYSSGSNPVIVLNKADCCDDVDAKLDSVARAAPGVDAHPISALTGSGIERLDAYLSQGQTIALLGSSGAGKSTLVNFLLGFARQETRAIRHDGRGTHTTTSRQLLSLPSGAALIDTPGMRELHLYDAAGALEEVFGDIESAAANCRFSNCAHNDEPGCGLAAAGIDPARLEGYRKLQREQTYLEGKTDARVRAAEKARWKKIHREAKAHMKTKHSGR